MKLILNVYFYQKYSLIIIFVMLEDFRDNPVCQSLIKFVDIVLDLYSPVPYEIRNEMRILQSTLLYGHSQ